MVRTARGPIEGSNGTRRLVPMGSQRRDEHRRDAGDGDTS
jgi:hypothetical protein